MKTLADLKIGDTVFTIEAGWTAVTHIDCSSKYPIHTTEEYIYTLDGKYNKTSKYPTMFLENPFEKQELGWMLVSHNRVIWYKRKVIFEKDGYFIALRTAESEEDLTKIYSTATWNFAKPLNTVSRKEIAEKFGVEQDFEIVD